MYPKTQTRPASVKGFVSEDQTRLRETILNESVKTRGQLYFILQVLQESREGARQLGHDDWWDKINGWIDRLGAMYNSLLYLQSNVYEFGLNTKFMRLKDLQTELKNVRAVRTDPLFIKCLQEMPGAQNAPHNTIEEEMAMMAVENAAAQAAKFAPANDPWS
jgi:hypothetical protein